MAIPASQIVQVNPGLLTAGGTDLEFNGLLLSESPLIPMSQMILPFPDAESVGDYFGLQSEEYKAAQIYFLGYNNSFKKPRALYVGARVKEERAAWLRGARWTGDLGELKAIGNGNLSITINSKTVTIDNLSFAAATSMSEAGKIIQDKINAELDDSANTVAVSFSSLTGAWQIENSQKGNESTISFASSLAGADDVAAALLLRREDGAVLSQGSEALDETENMEAFLDLTENFVCFTTVAKPAKAEALAYAKWTSSKKVAYLYIYWDDDPALLQPNNTASTAYALKEANVGAACGVWDSLDYAAMIMGTAASIDWNRRNGTITFAFKSLDGLPANVVTGVNANLLKAQGMNFMGDYATRNDQFIFLYPGSMFGSWKWIDTYLNAVWLVNALQVACMNGFAMTPRVPYNEIGYAMVTAWLQDPVNRALYNGVIDTGVTLTEAQKAEVSREAGEDISKILFTDGVYIKVAEPSPAIRVGRESPECSVWYTYGGSIHRLEVASRAIV